MTKYRHALPQLSNRIFLTDGGLETTLVFHDKIELPCFAAFDLMRTSDGIARLRGYYRRYARIAYKAGLGFILESPTWRASRDWGIKLALDEGGLADVNRRSIELIEEVRAEFETPRRPMVISGNVGPRGDGYSPNRMMRVAEAEDYHRWQIEIFRDTAADMVSASP